ncbi:non-homologous end joining protein Ku [Streptomyces rubiginosohelvolus]|uniref:Ku protein n=1 Tax=Streptomyces rubiginosohelvolus TaxID=67362 RepID=A0ABW6F3G8_9ACTN
MPRPLWAGAISFGLVTIPVKIVSATEDHDVHFHRVHLTDIGRVRTRKVCELDDQVVSQDEIGKGYEQAGETVPVTDEELEQMPLPTAKAIEIAAFVDADSIDPVRISDSYYLAADGQVAAKPYTLLRKALERSSKVAVAKLAWHGRERLGLLRIREGAIVLHSMKWPDEVRNPDDVAASREVEVGKEEIEQALQLAEQMTIEPPASPTSELGPGAYWHGSAQAQSSVGSVRRPLWAVNMPSGRSAVRHAAHRAHRHPLACSNVARSRSTPGSSMRGAGIWAAGVMPGAPGRRSGRGRDRGVRW